MNQFWEDVGMFIHTYGQFIIGTGLGVIAKLSYDIYMKRTLSILQWISIVGLSVFSGYLMSVFCVSKNMEKEAQYLVPIATLMGEKIVVYLFENYKDIINAFIKVIQPKK
jgi:hypothetical protein